MDLIVSLRPTRALASGAPRAGLLVISFDAGALTVISFDAGALTEEQRALLGTYVETATTHDCGTLGLKPGSALKLRQDVCWRLNHPTIEDVLAACQAEHDAKAAKEAKEVAEHEARVAEAIAQLASDPWLVRVYLYESTRADPRVVRYLAEVVETARERDVRGATEELLALPLDAWGHGGTRLVGEWRHVERGGLLWGLPCGLETRPTTYPGPAYNRAVLDPRIIDRLRHRQRQLDAEAARVAREKEDQKIRRREQISLWIQAHGNANQRLRDAEGLLPESEALDAIREHVLAPLTLTPFVRLVNTDVEHDEDCDGNVTFEVETVEGPIGPETYNGLCRVREDVRALGYATITLRRHVGACDECDGEVERYSALVRVPTSIEDVFASRDCAI